MTRANTTRWSPRASRSPRGCSRIALQEMGINARSWQGWQIPIETDAAHGAARIVDIDGSGLIERLEAGQVAVVAGLPGHRAGQAHRDARPRRLGYQRGGDRGGDPCRALRHLYRRRWRLYDRPAHRAEGAAPRARLLRGDAGDGLARRQGAAGALGRARHGARRADLRPFELRRPGSARARRCRRPARNSHLRRGRNRGKASRHRHRLFQGRGADLAPPGRRQAGRGGGGVRAARRGQHQRRHDRPERLGGRHARPT